MSSLSDSMKKLAALLEEVLRNELQIIKDDLQTLKGEMKNLREQSLAGTQEILITFSKFENHRDTMPENYLNRLGKIDDKLDQIQDELEISAGPELVAKMDEMKTAICALTDKISTDKDEDYVKGLPANVRMRKTVPAENMFKNDEEIELDFD